MRRVALRHDASGNNCIFVDVLFWMFEIGWPIVWFSSGVIVRYRIWHQISYYRNHILKHRDETQRAAWKTNPCGQPWICYAFPCVCCSALNISAIKIDNSSINEKHNAFEAGEGAKCRLPIFWHSFFMILTCFWLVIFVIFWMQALPTIIIIIINIFLVCHQKITSIYNFGYVRGIFHKRPFWEQKLRNFAKWRGILGACIRRLFKDGGLHGWYYMIA